MKRSLVFLLVFAACAAGAFGAPLQPPADSKPLETASILYVYAAEDCEVSLDGVSFGKAPVVLRGVSAGKHDLRAASLSLVYHRALLVDQADGITRIPVVLHPPWGSLVVDASPAGSRVTLDGADSGRTPLSADEVPVGAHDVVVTADGRVALRARVDVREDAVASVGGELAPGFSVRMSPSPPAGAVLWTGTDSSVFPDIPFFPAGPRQFVVKERGMRSFEFSVDPANTAAAPVQYDPVPARGFIRIVGARAGSTLFVDGVPSAYRAGAPVSVTPGLHSIWVTFPGFLPYSDMVAIEDGRTVVMTAVMAKDPLAKRQVDFASAWPFLAIGGALSVAGVILNTDSVAMGATSSYSGYSTWKYSTMAALGAGIGVTGGGLYVLFFKE